MGEFKDNIEVAGTVLSNLFKATTEGLESVVNIFKSFKDMILNVWGDADKQIAQLARNAGMGAAQYRALQESIVKISLRADRAGGNLAQRFGTTQADIAKIYDEQYKLIGRNVDLSYEQLENYVAIEKVLPETGKDILNGFRTFGIEAVRTQKILTETMKQATLEGVNFQRVTDNIKSNMMAMQSITFANGTKGLTAMAEQAAKINWNMSQTVSFAEKISEGNMDNLVQTASRLQVLGGSFAQFSNPLELLYEGTSNVEALQDRIVNMFSNLGTYNADSGMVELSRFDKMRVKQAASAMGLNSEDVFKMINTQGQRNEIERQIGNNGLSEEDREFLKNTAYLNENGQAVIADSYGNTREINQLTSAEVESIRSRKVQEGNTAGTIVDIAESVRSIEEIVKDSNEAQKQTMGGRIATQSIEQSAGDLTNMIAALADSLGLDEIASGLRSASGTISQMGQRADFTGIKKIFTQFANSIQGQDANSIELKSLLTGISSSIQGGMRTADVIETAYKQVLNTNPAAKLDSYMDVIRALLNGTTEAVSNTKNEKKSEGGVIPVVIHNNGGEIPIAHAAHAEGGVFNLGNNRDVYENGGVIHNPEVAKGVEFPFSYSPNAVGGTVNTIQEGEMVLPVQATQQYAPVLESLRTGTATVVAGHEDGGKVEVKAHEDGGMTAGPTPIAPIMNEISHSLGGEISVNVHGNGDITVSGSEGIQTAGLKNLIEPMIRAAIADIDNKEHFRGGPIKKF